MPSRLQLMLHMTNGYVLEVLHLISSRQSCQLMPKGRTQRAFIPFLITKQHQGTIGCSNNIIGSTAKRHENTYTGNELAGIGMLHKSNMVPVRKDSNDAKEIARMRRGYEKQTRQWRPSTICMPSLMKRQL